MSIIVTSRTRQRQPYGGLRVNWGNSLASGLTIAFAPASMPADAVRGDGKAAATDGLSSLGEWQSRSASGEVSTNPDVLTTAWSFAMAFRLGATPTGMLCVIARGANDSPTNSQGFAFAASHVLGDYSGALMQGPSYSNIGKPTGGTLAAGVDYIIGCSSDGSSASGYSNGVETVSASGLSSPATTGRLVIGMDSSGGQVLSPHLQLAWLYVWNRKLTADEQREIARYPWQLFAPVRRPVFFASAGGVYDLALSESASASESLGAAGALTSALAEAASAADVVSAAAAFAAAMSEVATATDGTAAVSVVLGALTEGGTGVDTLTSAISGAGVYDVALLESATTADAETAGGVFYVSVSEQGVGSEALSTGGVFYVTLADSGTGTDVLSGHLPTSFSAALSESVSALDVMVSTIPSAGTLWTAMDTAAASGWTAVATTNTWTIVPTT